MTLGILPKRNILHLLSLELDHENAKEMFTNYFEGCFGLLPSSIGAKTNSQRETGHGPIGNLPSPDRGTSVGSPKKCDLINFVKS